MKIKSKRKRNRTEVEQECFPMCIWPITCIKHLIRTSKLVSLHVPWPFGRIPKCIWGPGTWFKVILTNLYHSHVVLCIHTNINSFKINQFLFRGTLTRNLFKMNRNVFKKCKSNEGLKVKKGLIVFRRRLPILMHTTCYNYFCCFELLFDPFWFLLILNTFLLSVPQKGCFSSFWIDCF